MEKYKQEIIEAINTSKSMLEASKKVGINYKTFRKYAMLYNLFQPNQAGKGIQRKSSESRTIPLQDILIGKHPQYQSFKLKIRLIKECVKENICEECKITEWNNKELLMELDHINGISSDHRLENLRLLCPNCHAQTLYYRGRNVRDSYIHQ